jgi:hypothetical protein
VFVTAHYADQISQRFLILFKIHFNIILPSLRSCVKYSLPSRFPNKTVFLFSHVRATCLANLILLYLITRIMSPLLGRYLQSPVTFSLLSFWRRKRIRCVAGCRFRFPNDTAYESGSYGHSCTNLLNLFLMLLGFRYLSLFMKNSILQFTRMPRLSSMHPQLCPRCRVKPKFFLSTLFSKTSCLHSYLKAKYQVSHSK